MQRVRVRLFNNVGDRRYEPPASGSLGGIVFAEDSNASDYDIVVHSKDGPPHRVSKLHPSYIPLQYPLLLPFAEPGWSPQLSLYSISDGKRKNMTVNMYYSFQIHDRDARGDNNAHGIGKRVFLPSSFTGGPRYMYKHYQDALAIICRVYGNPQYFITFTCNVKWAEITRCLDKVGGMQAQDRPDIIARVFRIKVQQFLRFMRSKKTFGDVAAELYTIEFQKRGLPHWHTLLWVTSPFKVREAGDVDRYIRAEIPNPTTDPALHKIVTDLMMHGPCGLARPSSPCMRDSKCSKSFPKSFEATTRFDKDGYVHYRRRDTSERATKNGIALDNRYVVPYNEHLCRHFNAHINVEHCGWNMMIKYLFKYISKGADRVRFCITRSDEAGVVDEDATNSPVNEIKNFVDGRYICPHEASWRILNFPIHERTPAVEVLAVHLQDMQNVTLKENLKLQAIVRNPSFGKTTLTQWFESNKLDSDGLDLTYLNYSSRYRWYKTGMFWLSRVHLQNPGIGRLAYVHPASGELFFLRMLLCHQRGCKSFADIRTVCNVIHNTYRSACDALGLLGDDKEWLTAFIESSVWATSSELQVLFVHMLLFCVVSQPIYFWETQWGCMGDDIRHRFTAETASTNFFVNDSEIQQYILLELEKLLNSGTPSKSLSDFGLPMPSTSFLASVGNRLLMEETCCDRASLAAEHSQSHLLLNVDQLQVYNYILSAYHSNSQVLLFVYGHGGTGKTFLWRTIISYFRSVGKIVLAVAASGIASLLLPAGRTAHSRFKIPIDLTEQSTCANEIFMLRDNMRLKAHNNSSASTEDASEFASWLLTIGDGLVGEPDAKDPINTRRIQIPPQYLIQATENRLHALIYFIYDDYILNNPSADILSTRAIVCPTNETSDVINKLVLSYTPGDSKLYSSYDVMIPHGGTHADIDALYPQEFLNQLSFPGIPPHDLYLKINAPIILLRNINQTLGLCNGTRLIVSQLLPRIIEAQIITGTAIGTRVYIPRIKFVHNTQDLPFIFTRRQFPIKLCYAMTINKSQATSPASLKILIEGTDETTTNITNNVVFADFIDEVNNITERQKARTIEGDAIEATTKVKHIEHFDSKIKLQSCYKVDSFICSGPRTYRATVNHSASLVIGQKAKFHPVTNPNIPTVYFDFATYETIKTRIKETKILTDYIGRVVKNSMRSTSTGIHLRKTRLQDEMGNELEITLWPDKSHLIGDEVTTGDIVAITSTTVTEYNGLLQLESTYLTTVTVNPDVPQTADRVERLRALPPVQSSELHNKKVTLLDLKHNSEENFQGSKNFTCEASIKQIHEERSWYYVVCSKCSSKLYQEQDNGTLNFVCKDDDDITPNFRYSVNATITDATGNADAIFFNDSMQTILNISCEDMVTKHADTTNPKSIPDLLKSAIGKTKLLHVTLKNDGKIAVNNVSEITSTNPIESTSQIQRSTTFTPTTPIPKPATYKRQIQDSPGSERPTKHLTMNMYPSFIQEFYEIYSEFSGRQAVIRQLSTLKELRESTGSRVRSSASRPTESSAIWDAVSVAKKLRKSTGKKRCLYCGEYTFSNIFRYNIEVMVADESDTAKLILWNKASEKLLGEPAQDVIALYGDTARIMPNDIAEKILGKEGLFELVVSSEGLHVDGFNVSRLTVDDEIKDVYIMKYYPPANPEDESFSETLDYVEIEDRASKNNDQTGAPKDRAAEVDSEATCTSKRQKTK
ncbi:hypothetical protein CASFOL_016989 [Castilleja foliolosa]|uniref:ATP-dependent DNA helicase n=1 Tax=Castilleja foliolosa TaxID=1961234 RepID=A0ABD3DBM7_9LAMI